MFYCKCKFVKSLTFQPLFTLPLHPLESVKFAHYHIFTYLYIKSTPQIRAEFSLEKGLSVWGTNH